ncbi:hypothetical protein GCM10011504_15570 [Siccirubricoccus deserti]|uniref:DUF2382 domain-containing protein n=1 Tax=Siccirubricoccus deserti TaxID=2013562 RepID=A0A9X0QYG5_9PROT|nr:DUF2382 domain-containing protein [Siccirubricoccus deserti]MBC4015213.1 DUF2382 domain-containing protein [Siccirubricoccus deserti]GGC38090.1 hypothetical protein GCM10011504_15570 [Siccirubricoccus deserti]
MQEERAETVIPLIEERLTIERARRPTGRVRVAVTTTAEQRLVEETLRRREVEITRVPIGRTVAEPPPVREEAGSLVIPVVEEVLVVERRLVLREELRLRLPVTERRETATVTLRRQDVRIDHLPPAAQQQERQYMRTITGLFDSRAEAERTVETLVQQHGIDRNRVTVTAAGSENVTAGTTERRSEEHHGFLASLRDLFMPDEDRATYAEGLRRGGIMVAVQASDDQVEAVMDAFERHGAVDLDAREAEWRAGGWTGEAVTTAPYSAYAGDAVIGPSSDGTRTGLAAEPVGDAMTPAQPARPAAQGGRTAATGEEEAIPLVEERLRVGKRETGHGRVRVRTYVVETPVQEQVTLHEERVEVERRPVDRPLSDADRADFTDRVIEATETSEEAVVSKEARVREEVVVRKQAGERVETVSDTVRHTEVEVDDDRKRATPGTGMPPARNPDR